MEAQNSQKLQKIKSGTISTLSHNPNNKELEHERKIFFSSLNEILPTEMLKKILGYLDYKSTWNASQTCKQWKEIIDEFRFVEEASSK